MGTFWFWAVLIAGVVIGPIVLMVAIGALLPKAHTAESSRKLNATPEQVWEAITNYAQVPAWRAGLKSVDALPEHTTSDGKTYAAWKEQGKHGPMPFYVESSDPPRQYVTRIIDKGMPFGGSWTYTLETTEYGTRLNIREDGVVYNPFFRFMSRYFFGHHATMNAYLDDLEKHLGHG